MDLLCRGLIRRGLPLEDYDAPSCTVEENLFGRSTLKDDHYGSNFRWETEMTNNAAAL